MRDFVKRNWILIISIIYLIWPLDIISEFFGPIGLIDDGAVLAGTIVTLIVKHFRGKKETQLSTPNGLVEGKGRDGGEE